MPRGGRPQDGERRSGARNPWAPAVDPFSAGADVEQVGDWDTRPDETSEVILGFLQRRQAVMFGVSRDGGTVSIRVAVGDREWKGKTARDAGEFIGIIHELALWLRAQRDAERLAAD